MSFWRTYITSSVEYHWTNSYSNGSILKIPAMSEKMHSTDTFLICATLNVIWKVKSSAQMESILYPMFAICIHAKNDVGRDFFTFGRK